MLLYFKRSGFSLLCTSCGRCALLMLRVCIIVPVGNGYGVPQGIPWLFAGVMQVQLNILSCINKECMYDSVWSNNHIYLFEHVLISPVKHCVFCICLPECSNGGDCHLGTAHSNAAQGECLFNPFPVCLLLQGSEPDSSLPCFLSRCVCFNPPTFFPSYLRCYFGSHFVKCVQLQGQNTNHHRAVTVSSGFGKNNFHKLRMCTWHSDFLQLLAVGMISWP